jgi:5-methyltetrahydropteroyltriglutamate--homocysteine methyltransferase
MALKTTTIGAYPKPDYIPLPDWFDTGHADSSAATRAYREALRDMGEAAEATFARGVKQVIEDQVSAGIDIPTDGEVRRENYVHYHCRHLEGFDFEALEHKVLREGSYETDLPTITGPVKAGAPFLPHDWRSAQSFTERPVKITMPGPMTITDTTVDLYYDDDVKLGRDLSEALNAEVLALAEAGCRHIQIDEPVFARKPRQALDYGIENLERCWHGVPAGVTKVTHMCCGYPNYLDQSDYLKANARAYFDLAAAMDETATDVISIEDAHRHNDLTLLELFHRTGIILGVVAIADSRVESVEEVRTRLQSALQHIPAERLMAGPDCGLGFLGRELSIRKLKVLSEAAHSL